MAGSRPKEIFFVYHGQKQSKRQQEVQDGRRRAHAARHAARKIKELTSGSKAVERDGNDGSPDAQAVVHRSPRGPVRRYPTLPPIESLLGHNEDAALAAALFPTSPLSILSQAMTDPFQTTIMGTLPVVLQGYLRDAQTVIWPSMVPLVPPAHAALFYQRSPVDSPSEIDYQIDAAAAISLQYVHSTNRALLAQIAAVGRKHRDRSIAWVNSKVVNACGPPSPNVIAALLSLVSHSGLSQPQVHTRYRVSPMAMGDFSALFGSNRVLPEDMSFLYQVVELRGGDDWVGSDAVDEDLPLRLMLNHFDIFVSTRLGTPPMWRSMASFPPASWRNTALLSHDSSSSHQGLSTVTPTMPFSDLEDPSLLSAVLTLRTSTQMLDLHFTRSPTAPPSSVIVHTRNLAQHQLLMLYDGPNHSSSSCNSRPTSPSSTTGTSARLYGSTRLQGVDAIAHPAALLFSDLVLFVLPPASGTRPRLLRELLFVLKAALHHTQRTTSISKSVTPPSHPQSAQTAPGRGSGLVSGSASASASPPACQSHSPQVSSSPSPPPPLQQQQQQQECVTNNNTTSPPSTTAEDHPQQEKSRAEPDEHQNQHQQKFLLWATLLLAVGSVTYTPPGPIHTTLTPTASRFPATSNPPPLPAVMPS